MPDLIATEVFHEPDPFGNSRDRPAGILPVGLSLFGRLAPGGFAATAIALWYFANFFGNLAAGGLGTHWSVLSPAQFFALVAAIVAFCACLLLLFERPVRRAAQCTGRS